MHPCGSGRKRYLLDAFCCGCRLGAESRHSTGQSARPLVHPRARTNPSRSNAQRCPKVATPLHWQLLRATRVQWRSRRDVGRQIDTTSGHTSPDRAPLCFLNTLDVTKRDALRPACELNIRSRVQEARRAPARVSKTTVRCCRARMALFLGNGSSGHGWHVLKRVPVVVQHEIGKPIPPPAPLRSTPFHIRGDVLSDIPSTRGCMSFARCVQSPRSLERSQAFNPAPASARY